MYIDVDYYILKLSLQRRAHSFGESSQIWSII